MRLTDDDARARFTGSRVARLATTGVDGRPHLVPVTFAAYGATVAIAVDHKPKSTTRLKRLDNIEHDPRVCLLADQYDDAWRHLWWARADGTARVRYDGPERRDAVDRLADRYPQYREHRPDGAVILVAVAHWSGWTIDGTAPDTALPPE